MASNPPYGDGRRQGVVKKRSQLKTKIEGEDHWTRRKMTKNSRASAANNNRSSAFSTQVSLRM